MTARTITGLAIGGLAFLMAAPAFAAGGSLEPFPDIADVVGACSGGKDCDLASELAGSMFIRMLIGFVLLIPIANWAVFKPMLAVLDERDARIAGASAQAKDVARRADDVFERYQGAVTAARRDAEEIRRQTLDDARKSHARVMAGARSDAEREVASVREQVGASAEQARGQLRGDADALARNVAEQVLGRSL